MQCNISTMTKIALSLRERKFCQNNFKLENFEQNHIRYEHNLYYNVSICKFNRIKQAYYMKGAIAKC